MTSEELNRIEDNALHMSYDTIANDLAKDTLKLVARIRILEHQNRFWRGCAEQLTNNLSNPEMLLAEITKHEQDGLGDGDGPFDPDCPCRGTDMQRTCAENGCGFCKVAESRRPEK